MVVEALALSLPPQAVQANKWREGSSGLQGHGCDAEADSDAVVRGAPDQCSHAFGKAVNGMMRQARRVARCV